jgi:hypothetical protein
LEIFMGHILAELGDVVLPRARRGRGLWQHGCLGLQQWPLNSFKLLLIL